MNRVQVENLRVRAPSRPTAQVVDTYVRPEMPQANQRAAQIAEAFGRILPGVTSRVYADQQKEEKLKAERAYLMDGAATDVNDLNNGTTYAQNSKIFLQHYKELRAKGYVQQQLNAWETKLKAGELTDEQGAPLIVQSSSQFSALAQGQISKLAKDLGQDPLVFDTVVPAIREWQHNTTVEFEASLDRKLKADRQGLFVTVAQGITDKLDKLGPQAVAAELTKHADDYYALSKDPNTNKLVVDELVSKMKVTGDTKWGRLALALTPGNRPLANSLQADIVTGMKSIVAEQEALARATKVAAEDARKKQVSGIKNKAFDAVMNLTPGADPYKTLAPYMDELAAAGGERDDVMSYVGFATGRFDMKTPAQEQAAVNLRQTLRRMSMSPNRGQSMADAADVLMLQPNSGIHPNDRQAILTYAASLEGSTSLLANPDVARARNDTWKAYLGELGPMSKFSKDDVQKRLKIEDTFNSLFQAEYAKAYAKDPGMTAFEIDAIARNIRDTVIKQEADGLKLEGETGAAANASFSSAQKASKNFMGYGGINSVDEIVPKFPVGFSNEQAVVAFREQVRPDPMGKFESSNPKLNKFNGMSNWEAFDAMLFPGAYAYYTNLLK